MTRTTKQSARNSIRNAAPIAATLVLANAACAAGAGKASNTPAAEDVVLVLAGGTTKDEYHPPPAPAVRVNQVGYLPPYSKHATIKSAATTPLKWELIDAAGQSVASGETKPFGDDPDAGDRVHIADFSSFQQPGSGYRLRVGKDESFPFDIRADIYHQMKYDAFWYFYHARSGIELKLPYAGKPEWTRPAGHLSDRHVPCAKDAGCSYSLDVAGGWYDAGDHGKYVVNGGISLWTVQNQYERMLHWAEASLADFADGKLRVPEQGNGRPDIIDEARWEMEWMLKMQVPADKDANQAGLVHHKMHDEQWSGIGYAAPSETQLPRSLRPVSTAATLNLAATAAQSARIWDELDAEFAAQCLKAAELAWSAANRHPKLLAPATDKQGGGPYDDAKVSDEFYWAAAELLITTGKPEYEDFITKSPHYLKIPQSSGKDGGGAPSAMTWQSVAALGTISLAVVPNPLGEANIKRAREVIVSTADSYLGLIDRQGHRIPMASGGGKYPWGSNSFVLNNMLIMALAHDFSREVKYLDGVIAGMNYILGVNPLGQSYVTGYGDRPLQNPHHRFWAKQVADTFPSAPPGCVSGGPNSSLQDPEAAAALQGCKPQKCFMDHIDSWSTNEITINWNGPFAWVVAFLDEKSKPAASEVEAATAEAGGEVEAEETRAE